MARGLACARPRACSTQTVERFQITANLSAQASTFNGDHGVSCKVELCAAVHAVEHCFSQLARLSGDADQNLVLARFKLHECFIDELFCADHHVVGDTSTALVATQTRIDDRGAISITRTLVSRN